ncbi:hypothetical protein EVAR_17528_1 [Eumeta japonica]|uniref:Uncharacterized protein n=1 Tax=Eumeta variegata TaxID=151549 RepID=A0A4C1WR54_EUMVA|nr:hypothetical protein EVAR_17528_1 [Eumeta japonica]
MCYGHRTTTTGHNPAPAFPGDSVLGHLRPRLARDPDQVVGPQSSRSALRRPVRGHHSRAFLLSGYQFYERCGPPYTLQLTVLSVMSVKLVLQRISLFNILPHRETPNMIHIHIAR